MTTSKKQFDLYIPVRTPDKDRVADFVLEIKGKERSMAEFSEATKVTASMLSRIVNGGYTKPISIDILEKIVQGAHEDCEVTLKDLANASGLETQEQIDERISRDEMRRQAEIERLVRTQKICKLVQDSLWASRRAIRSLPPLKGKVTNIQDLFPNDIGGQLRVELLGEDKNIAWHFMIATSFLGSEIRKVVETKRFFRHYASLFLQMEWEPEKFVDTKVSFVFAEREDYESFLELVKNAKIKTDTSAILVDLDAWSVVEETSIAYESFGTIESILCEAWNRAVLSEDDDWTDEDIENYEEE